MEVDSQPMVCGSSQLLPSECLPCCSGQPGPVGQGAILVHTELCWGGVSAVHMDSWFAVRPLLREQDAQVAARERMELTSGVT